MCADGVFTTSPWGASESALTSTHPSSGIQKCYQQEANETQKEPRAAEVHQSNHVSFLLRKGRLGIWQFLGSLI